MPQKLKHDEIIRSAFENPLVSKEFFQMHLPSQIQNLFSFETLKMEKDSFVDKELKKSIVDILFSAKFGDNKGYLFLLLEHQSTSKYNMALRLFKYMFKIAEYHKKATKSRKFPFIYPLIFYNGQKKYNAPRNLWELFENSELVKATWSGDYQLINVHDIPEKELKEKAWSGILQFFMKHIHERDLLKRWEEVADLLPKFAKVDIGIDYIELILCYTLTRIKQGDIIEVEKLLKSKLNPKKRENIMKSIAQHSMQQGKAEAEAVKLVNIKMQKEKVMMTKKMQEEKITMAKKMLEEGIPLESVIKITELSIADLEK